MAESALANSLQTLQPLSRSGSSSGTRASLGNVSARQPLGPLTGEAFARSFGSTLESNDNPPQVQIQETPLPAGSALLSSDVLFTLAETRTQEAIIAQNSINDDFSTVNTASAIGLYVNAQNRIRETIGVSNLASGTAPNSGSTPPAVSTPTGSSSVIQTTDNNI